MNVLYFTASWCVPCKRFGPVMDAFAIEYGIPVAKVDVDEFPDSMVDYEVKSVPTVVLMDNGTEVKRFVGARPLAKVAQELEV